MSVNLGIVSYRPSWIGEKLFRGMSFAAYVRSLLTPFNIIAALVWLPGFILVLMRYAFGLGAVMSGSNEYPWGLFISYGLLCGVPFASTGFIMATAYHLFGMKAYHPLVRLGILTGFLGYFFAVCFLLIDLGRPWRLPYPMFVSFGTASVLFLVAWHVALYLSTQLLEFCPAIFEWLGFERCQQWVTRITVGATIFGVILSTLHQSALGALFLLMPGKVHPLWYTPNLPVFFFVQSIYAGLSVMILVSSLCRRFLKNQTDGQFTSNLDNLLFGLAKAAALVLFSYYSLKLLAVAHENEWYLLVTPYGYLFLTEIILFVFMPCYLYVYGVRYKNVKVVQLTSVLSMVGVVFSRFNISIIGFNWTLPNLEIPGWKEFAIAITILTTAVLVFRWIVSHMPVLREFQEHDLRLVQAETRKMVERTSPRPLPGIAYYSEDVGEVSAGVNPSTE